MVGIRGVTCLPTALLVRRPPVAVYFFTIHSTYALRGRSLFVSRFSHRPAFLRPSGGHIFLCVKKDMEERHAKGLQSRPLESCFYTGVWRGDVRRPYEFALVQLTRFRPVRGVLRTASTDSIVLRLVRRMRKTYRISSLICCRQSGGCSCAFVFWGTQKPSQRGRCRRMSAEEGMRRELTIEEPTGAARFVTFYPLPSAQVLPPSP